MRAYFQNIYLMGQGVTTFSCAETLTRHKIDFKLLEVGGVKSPFFFKRVKATEFLIEKFDKDKLAHLCASNVPTLIFSVSNTYIFPAELVSNPNITIINYHNALLPRHRGMHAEAWAIYEGDTYAGVTWHRVDAGIDTGGIVCQAPVEIKDNTTSIELLNRQSAISIELFEKNLASILDNTYPLSPNTGGHSQLHLKKHKPNNGILDASWPEDKIWRFLRAMDYGPYQTLGTPVIKIDDAMFTWQSYERLKSGAESRSLARVNDDVILNNSFLLRGIRKVDPV